MKRNVWLIVCGVFALLMVVCYGTALEIYAYHHSEAAALHGDWFGIGFVVSLVMFLITGIIASVQ